MGIPIYHRIPQNMQGDILYPLNVLKTIHPEIYEMQAKKYEGREELMGRVILELDCLWNDVLHFSVINPRIIEQELANIGFNYKPGNFIQYDSDQLDQTKIILYHEPIEGNRVVTRDFSYLRELDLTNVSDATLAYYKESFEKKAHPFLYYGLPHFLYKGEVSLKKGK